MADNPQHNHGTNVTLISENISIPPFTGTASESVHSFIRRVTDECTRRSATNDAEKLAILKSRICYDSSSLAGKLVKSDKFLSFTAFDVFTAALISHFSSHSKLGATHSFLKVSQTLTSLSRTTQDVYRAENVASSLSSELVDQLKSSDWFDNDGKMSAENFKRLMSYLLFTVQLDQATFSVASDIEFKKDDYLYDVCKRISEKAPPTAQPVSAAQSQPAAPAKLLPAPHVMTHIPNPSRGRSSSRRSDSRPRSGSRSSYSRRRNPHVTCHRCGIKGHTRPDCTVILDSQGNSSFNPNAFCSLHNKRGHSLEDCRLYQYQLQVESSAQPSGNASRHSLPHLP